MAAGEMSPPLPPMSDPANRSQTSVPEDLAILKGCPNKFRSICEGGDKAGCLPESSMTRSRVALDVPAPGPG